MGTQSLAVDELARLIEAGESITLLGSSACTDPAHCHRTLLKGLIEERMRDADRSSNDSASGASKAGKRGRGTQRGGGTMALWFFQRTAPGDIRRIPLPSMQRFLAGERALRHDGDGYVRCIGMSLEVHGNKPAQVARVWFSKIRVNGEGRVDPHHRHETAKLARSETPQAAHSHAGASVVAA